MADDLRWLEASGYPLAANTLRTELARDQFVDSVSDVRLKLRLKNMPATLDNAVARAVQLEALWVMHPSSNQRPEFKVPKPSEGDPESVLAMAPPGANHGASPPPRFLVFAVCSGTVSGAALSRRRPLGGRNWEAFMCCGEHAASNRVVVLWTNSRLFCVASPATSQPQLCSPRTS